MIPDVYLTFLFWMKLIIFGALLAISLWNKKLKGIKKILVFSILIILFFINEYIKEREINSVTNNKMVKNLISSVEQFQRFHTDQKLRSNIFILDKNDNKYKIRYSYNMENDSDKNIEIPTNLGCTGEAWRTKNQIWGDEEKIFSRGEFRIPEEELKKVPKVLKWICSTPIVNRKGEVIAVLNVDGSKEMNESQKNEIKIYCNRLVGKLKEYLK